MNLRDYHVFFVVVTFIVALLVASPALQRLLVYPRTEFFSELWLLGPEHKAEDYPYNMTRYENYTVYLGIGNQLGSCAYYQVEVKLINESQTFPSTFGPIENRTPSAEASLYNITRVVADQATWEEPLAFSFDYVNDSEAKTVLFSSILLNGVTLNLTGNMASWNSTSREFPTRLTFELWLFNVTSNNFEYHSRAVWLSLNMTIP